MEAEKTKQVTVEPQEVKRGFPEAVLSKEQWGQVERACIAGMSYADASRVFNVKQEAIRQRAFRENWLTPIKIENMAKQKAVTQVSQGVTIGEKAVLSASDAVSGQLEGYKGESLLGLAKTLKNTFTSETVQNMQPQNVGEVVQMGNLMLKLYNVGTESVQVNIAQAFAGMDEGPVVETEVINGEDERDSAGESNLYFIDDE